jgi:hypothetical protein
MTAVARSIVARLRAVGVTLTVTDAGRVRFKAGVPLPPDLLAEARAHRDAIAALLLAGEISTGASIRATYPPTVTRDDLDPVRRAALIRPPSWSDPAARPSAGCFCSCCKTRRWWCEREQPKGWRCYTCHPPDCMGPDETVEVRT